MTELQNTAVLGAGVIGMSWAALFLALRPEFSWYPILLQVPRKPLTIYRDGMAGAQRLGLIKSGSPGRLSFHRSAAEAVMGTQTSFRKVCRSALISKGALFAEIEPALKSNAIVASSASGLTLSEMQVGWANPSRFVVGHPFNPPHFIPRGSAG